MSQALYRRYRPETFAEVIGQQHVTEPLMQALRSGRISHAYLFSGPRGCGKTTSARILARCLNCAEGPTDTPCGKCPSCVELGRGGSGSLDVVEIDAASHNGVDDARDLRERAAFAPVRDRFKIFILDEAHMVTQQGFNALLKIVEEPPEHVKFIFATTEPEKVIGTIRSRTHHYPFRLVPPGVMLDYMATLCQAEKITVAEGVLPLVVRAGGGSVRDTESVLDQLMAGAQDSNISYERAVALLGYTPENLLEQMIGALVSGDGGEVFRTVEAVVEAGQDPRRFAEDLLDRLRDLVVIAAAGDGAGAVLQSVPADQLHVMRQQASALGLAALSQAADAVNEGLSEMTGATSPRLQLELLCARMLVRAGRSGAAVAPASQAVPPVAASAPATQPPAATATHAPITNESAMPSVTASPADAEPRREQIQAEAPVPAPPVAQPPAFADHPAGTTSSSHPSGAEGASQDPSVPRDKNSPSSQDGLTSQIIASRWDDVLDRLQSIRRFTKALVEQNAHIDRLEGTVLFLAFPNAALLQAFQGGGHKEAVAQALAEVFGQEIRVDGSISSGQDDAPAAAATSNPPSTPETVSPSLQATKAPAPEPAAEAPQAAAEKPPARKPAQKSPAKSPSTPVPPAAAVPDAPSADDKNVEESSMVGVEVIERMLGGEIIEEIDENG